MNTRLTLGVLGLLAGFALACGGGGEDADVGGEAASTAGPSEKGDVVNLCKAIMECDECDDAKQDAAVAAAGMGTEWGKGTQAALQSGDGIGDEARLALVSKITETKAGEESLDCSLIEAFWAE